MGVIKYFFILCILPNFTNAIELSETMNVVIIVLVDSLATQMLDDFGCVMDDSIVS